MTNKEKLESVFKDNLNKLHYDDGDLIYMIEIIEKLLEENDEKFIQKIGKEYLI
ncbi:hypothetical protein ACE4RV_08355 [Acetobacter persici]|uniref:hypothetical protein n=1 Tax=Acetobacter persici TaxID=1076596 RepID=UPI0036DBE5FD